MKDQHGNALTKWDKIKKRWEQNTKELYKRGERMADSFWEESFEEECTVLESGVTAVLRAVVRNKSPGAIGLSVELFQATEIESIKIHRVAISWEVTWWHLSHTERRKDDRNHAFAHVFSPYWDQEMILEERENSHDHLPWLKLGTRSYKM